MRSLAFSPCRQSDRNKKPALICSRWGLSLAMIGLMAMSSGCGGGDDEQTAAPPPAPPKPAPVAIPAAEEPEPDAPKQAAAPTTRPNANQKPAGKPLPPEQAQFAFTAIVDHPNFTTLDEIEREKFISDSQLTATRPAAGQNSGTFIVEQMPQQNSGTKNPRLQLPRNFVELPEFGYDASGWPKRILSRADKSVMAFVPAGVFMQGKEGVDENLGPQFSAYLGPYYIDEHEVTLENFNKFRAEVSAKGDRPPEEPINYGGNAQEPAIGVLWRDAISYAEFLGKELPTEAEWEKAARGASGFDHPWGFGRPAYRKDRSPGQITPVRSYPTDRSYYGVFDMAGNAREWCADWYAPDAHEQALEAFGQVPRNWKGPRKAEPQFHRVIKGSDSDWAVWSRDSASMSDRVRDVGFRCVLRVPDSDS